MLDYPGFSISQDYPVVYFSTLQSPGLEKKLSDHTTMNGKENWLLGKW
jgi:hypothetical protein